jgi:hypothetical protein
MCATPSVALSGRRCDCWFRFYHRLVVAGAPLTIAAQVFDGRQPMKGFRADTRVVAPSLSIAGLLAKFKTQLQTIRPAPAVVGHLVPPGVIPVVPGEEGTASLTSPFAPVSPTLPVAPLPPTAISGVLTGQFKNTKQQGSYNVVVTANGTSPISNTRFVRTELVSVLVK